MPTIEPRETLHGTKYQVRVRHPNPRPGKRGYTSATFATLPEAEQFVRDVNDRGVEFAMDMYRQLLEDDGAYTLDEWAVIHFGALTEASGATIRRYRRIYATAWQPHLGHLKLTRIDRVAVARALNALEGKDKTRRNKWAVLTDMFKKAVMDGHLVRSPALGVKLGRHTDHETEEHRYLTHPEFWAVLDATPTHWKPLVMTLGGTGMRWGEAAALTVADVDLAEGTIRVTKAEKQDPNNPSNTIVGPTKTRRSRRTITLPPEVVEALTPLVTGRARTERLFLPPKGGALRHRTFYRDIWLRKCVQGSGIASPHPRIHDLRHSHIAWLIAQNVPLPVIQARAGHEKITTTIDTYGHLIPDVQRAATEAAGQVFAAKPLALAP